MTEELEEYILRHIDKEGETLSRLDRETHLYHLRPRMCSGHLQGKLLKMFVRMIRPKRILELGTFTGYSALAMAEGLVPGAELHTIEIDDELEDFIREHFCQAQQGKNIHLHIGDARDIIPQVGGKFDLVFMDANKRQYLEYYNLVFDYVNPDGFIIADNTLWDGKVVDYGKKLDAQTAGILEFNDFVAADERVEKVIIPLRDGLTIIHKLPLYSGSNHFYPACRRCARGTLQHHNLIRTTRRRRAHGNKRTSQTGRFEDALLPLVISEI